MRRGLPLVAMLVACRPPVAAGPPPAPVPVPVPATPTDPARPPEPEPERAPEPAHVAPQTLQLSEGETVAFEAGLSVTFLRFGHKHAADGGAATGLWTLRVDDGETKQEIELRTNDRLHAERVHAGRLVVVEDADGDLRVTVHANAPDPLTQDEARARLVARFTQMGVREGSSTASSVDDGVFSMIVAAPDAVYASGALGLYTRELVAFDRPAAREWRPRFRKPAEKLRLAGGAKKTTNDGIEVRRVARRHKHYAKPKSGAVAIVEFRVTHDGSSKSVEWYGQELYAELAAFDRVFVFTESGDDRYLVRVYGKGHRTSQGTALHRATRLAHSLGIETDSSAISEEAGAYAFSLGTGSRTVCRGLVGAYTGRVVRLEVVNEVVGEPQGPPLP